MCVGGQDHGGVGRLQVLMTHDKADLSAGIFMTVFNTSNDKLIYFIVCFNMMHLNEAFSKMFWKMH